MFFHLFRLATLAKGALALSLVAGAYGAGNADVQEYRLRTTAGRVDPTHEPTPKPEPAAKPEPRKDVEDSEKSARSSFEALLKECVGRYSRAAENTKEACERAMAASGLDANAFWAKYGSYMTPPSTKPTKTEPASTTPFDALLSECVARYRRGADNTTEACQRAIVASGLTTTAFAAKYRSLLVPPTKPQTTEAPKPMTTPRPVTTDPAVNECLAKYETLKALKTGPAEAFEAALRTFKETCRSLLATKPHTTEPQKPVTTPTTSPKPGSTDPAVKECLAKYEALKALKTGPADAFEAAGHTFNETCRRLLEARR